MKFNTQTYKNMLSPKNPTGSVPPISKQAAAAISKVHEKL
jgi:hypothetical protein